MAYVAGAVLCALAAMICLDVASRSLRLFATPWTLDVAQYMLYIITFFGAPWVLREGGHISVEVVVEHLPAGAQRRVRRLQHLLGATVCAVLFVFSCKTLWRSAAGHVLVYQTFVFPEWYLFSIAPPVFLILSVVFLRWLLRPAETPRQASEEGI